MKQMGKIIHLPLAMTKTDPAEKKESLLTRIPMAALIVGSILLTILVVRGAIMLKQGDRWKTEAGILTEEIQTLQVLASEEAAQASEQIPLFIPNETHPALIIQQLENHLQAAGIRTYRYRIIPPEHLAQDEESPEYSHAAFALNPSDDSKEPLPAESFLADLVLEKAPTVDNLIEWKIPLRIIAPYDRISAFLGSLRETGRIWFIPQMNETKTGSDVTADLLLLTWSQFGEAESSSDGETIEEVQPAQAGMINPVLNRASRQDLNQRDPFQGAGAISSAGAGRVIPKPPTLGAIRWGSDPMALLDGRIVRVGSTIGPWRVIEIANKNVVLRHETGAERHLSVDTDIVPGQ
ncbi:MAG: hypothetical protein KJ970_03750 [Candidatus Eisenbacteria bacterium]|uniref:Uncharacterized protein n=1 Tax=Eiseniibacteriota bacterium TaxID=2212470 RepID=A0A948RU44_UNCEI|nr:hypothetical protein [Candidatus Eisenbacteria bacterium]MBU1949906.1 hypothetical protein [Candidatus Eisenbacteria bacterium]MBU2690016.1 hypothetical protein [Candidatus Eisenbacteria bacterium]